MPATSRRWFLPPLDAFGWIDLLIINVSATTAISGCAHAVNHFASKARLNMSSRCMALKLAPAVRVNGPGLGFVDSALVRELYSEQQLHQVIGNTPLRRMTSYEETASLIQLLASDATAFVTGRTLRFDRGRCMH